MPVNKFKELNDELEEILADLQSGDQDVDEVIKKYERGIELIEKLEKYLSDATNKITKVKPKGRKS